MKARRLIPLGIVAVAAIVLAAVAALAASGSSDAASGKVYRIGLVSDVGRFNDRSFNQSALEGLKRAQKPARRQGPSGRVPADERLRSRTWRRSHASATT